jgi:hypothetical protein
MQTVTTVGLDVITTGSRDSKVSNSGSKNRSSKINYANHRADTITLLA